MTDRCFLCCQEIQDEGERTVEHFIPRSFYPNRRLPDEPGLTLPAHRACNASTSDEEEWLQIATALSDPFGKEQKSEAWDRAIRALVRERPAGPLGTRFVAEMLLLPDGGAGLHLGDRAVWLAAKIAKGLCATRAGIHVPNGRGWSVRIADYERFIASTPTHLVEVPSNGDISQRGSVLLAKGEPFPWGDWGWFMMLRGQAFIFAVSGDRDEWEERLRVRYPNYEHRPNDFAPLTWPKARPARDGGCKET